MRKEGSKSFKAFERQGVLRVEGKISWENAVSLYKEGCRYIQKISLPYFNFQLSQVENSLLLVLMLEWLKFSRKKHKKCVYQNIPEILLKMIKVYQLEEFLASDFLFLKKG